METRAGAKRKLEDEISRLKEEVKSCHEYCGVQFQTIVEYKSLLIRQDNIINHLKENMRTLHMDVHSCILLNDCKLKALEAKHNEVTEQCSVFGCESDEVIMSCSHCRARCCMECVLKVRNCPFCRKSTLYLHTEYNNTGINRVHLVTPTVNSFI